jgi:hypothetical protein
MFFYGLLVYGFSKEYIVLWYDFTEYLILAAAVITVVKKFELIFILYFYLNDFILDLVHLLEILFEVGIKKKLIVIRQLLIILKQ